MREICPRCWRQRTDACRTYCWVHHRRLCPVRFVDADEWNRRERERKAA